jgi:hypothetical protein
MMNFVGFSQDTTIVVEPPPIRIDSVEAVQSLDEIPQELRLIIENPPPRSSAKEPLRLPGQKNPKLAGWLSTALPGAGQVYNGQWWKVPIIYGGAGFLIYLHNFNKTERDLFQREYRLILNNAPDSLRNPVLAMYSPDQILSARNYYRRNLELVYVFSGLLYLLNIVDAVVFAHLATFDVSDNLTMRIEPFALPDLSPFASNQRMPMHGGLRLTFTLK